MTKPNSVHFEPIKKKFEMRSSARKDSMFSGPLPWCLWRVIVVVLLQEAPFPMDGHINGKKIINVELEDSDNNDSNLENSTLQSEGSSWNSSNRRTYKKNARDLTEVLVNDNMKFLNNFDPEQSNREKRKLTRKIHSESGKKIVSVYDENGALNSLEKDVCDCLTEECPGCHFPCPKCRSCKCGVECRVSRKWMYEVIENEGEVPKKSQAATSRTEVIDGIASSPGTQNHSNR